MVTRQQVVRSCDRCGSEEGTEHFRMQFGPSRKTVSFDACELCKAEAPLDDWIKGGSKPGRRMSRKVVSLETVERAASRPARRVRKG